MWSQVSDGQVLRIHAHPIGLTIGDTQYPKNIFTLWSNAELKDVGIYPYRELSVDTRYHYSGTISYEIKEEEVIGSYPSFTDKDIDVLKTEMIEQAKIAAFSLMARDDWMSIREAEGGTAMPDNVKTYRVALRKESKDKETAIKALGDLDAVKLYEATPYIETREDDDGEEHESERHLKLATHYFAEDPLAKDDPTFVSLVKK